MIKLSVMYPHNEGAKFDFDYYLGRHFDLVQQKWGGLMKDAYVTRGLSGGDPGSSPAFHVMAHITFASLDDLNQAVSSHGAELFADVPNFTDITPLVQVSEVLG
jgi:uncharacterized protein (TIGR02118 family)